ncbi:MAG: DUF2254 domain-containing protein [Anaerolineae bacterium]|nr:DUF2254 domain-containing protein [Anaerolineae bacterium]
MDIHLRLWTIWNNLQSSLWFRPIIAALLAVVMAVGSTRLDSRIVGHELFQMAPDNARLILSAIANSMLTVVALTFSTIMVVLVLASQQFSPRILGNFARDRVSQNVLSMFIGTFVYSLLVMGGIKDTNIGSFIPALPVIIAIILALLSVGALIYFIDHIAKSVQVNYIIDEIDKKTVAGLHTIFSDPTQNGCRTPQAVTKFPLSVEACTTVTALKRGYIQAIDFNELVSIGQEYNIVVHLERMVGEFVAKRSILLRIRPQTSISDDIIERLLDTFEIGPTRTMFQDTLLGLRQLVDMALKAISPAINDPTTAVSCIDALSNILLQAAPYPDPPAQYCDDRGDVRLVTRPVTFKAMVDLAIDQIRQYARSEVTVSLRLLEALAEIAPATSDPQRRDILWRHARIISRAVERNILEPVDRQKMNEHLNQLAQQLGKRPDGVLLTIDEALLNIERT